jgi:hypothetical protein
MSVQFSAVSCFTSASTSVYINVALREFAFSIASLPRLIGYNIIVRGDVTAETSVKAGVYCSTVHGIFRC